MKVWKKECRKRITGMVFCLLIGMLTGCGTDQKKNEEGSAVTTTIQKEDNMNFMKETYGFTEDELKGIDIEKLIQHYQLRSRDYTAEEIREILRDEGDMYMDDGSSEIFYLLSVEGRTLTEEDEICRIGFYCNSGTFVQKSVFDLENHAVYVDTPDPRDLTDIEVDSLKDIAHRWEISSWKQRTEGKELPSTGNYAWRLSFQLTNGEFAVYSGYTQDMTNLPEHFENVRDELQSIIKDVSSDITVLSNSDHFTDESGE